MDVPGFEKILATRICFRMSFHYERYESSIQTTHLPMRDDTPLQGHKIKILLAKSFHFFNGMPTC